VINPTDGCRFRQRCPYAIDVCAQVTPALRFMGPGHDAACHVAAPEVAETGGSVVGASA
jgi:peptide/nickel transport system ATP-binding protein